MLVDWLLGCLVALVPQLLTSVLQLLLPGFPVDEGVHQVGHVLVLILNGLPSALLHVPGRNRDKLAIVPGKKLSTGTHFFALT